MASPSLMVFAPSPSTRGGTIADRRSLLVRALSGDLLSQRASSCSPPASGGRRPLFPLPPSIDSPQSLRDANSPADDEDASSASSRRSFKRVRSFHASHRLSALLSRQGSFHGANSPFARPRAETAPAAAHSPIDLSDAVTAPRAAHERAFRPPPIRTMTSLEGWGGDEHGRASATAVPMVPSCRSTSTSSLRAPSELARAAPLPPTPAARGRRGFGRPATSPVPCMSLVAPNLYVGDEHAASSVPELMAAGVTHVLNCSALPNRLDGVAGAPSGPHYLQLGLMDNTSDLPRMQEALGTGVEFIGQALANGGTVLVHCHRGVSRSATLAIAYLVRAMQQPAEAIFEVLRTRRSVIDPNLGYWIALTEWERRVLPPALLRGRSSALSPAGGVRPLSRAG